MFDIQRGNNTRPLEIKYMLVHNSALLPREIALWWCLNHGLCFMEKKRLGLVTNRLRDDLMDEM